MNNRIADQSIHAPSPLECMNCGGEAEIRLSDTLSLCPPCYGEVRRDAGIVRMPGRNDGRLAR